MANRLKHESSPYLLQHAANPVDWYPWGEEALELARKLDRPIFLSIGYAACHWCHVMAHESFEDEQTARVMNEYFVNIKVDREERPDLDHIYMSAVIALTGQGGWPLSVFLTPEGKPFFGGTYFPPSRRYNMPSFLEVLEYLHTQWQEKRERVIQSGEELTRHLLQSAQPRKNGGALDRENLKRAARNLFSQYDWKDGGWGAAPKFPASSAIEALLLHYHRTRDRLALDMASHALTSMRRGGIHDQIGGGFHRYSVDSHWLIPHFEKMLYDNALLLRAYLHHWQLTKDPGSSQVVESMISFLRNEMRDEQGGFYSSLDADSEGREGTFYVWSQEQFLESIAQPSHKEFALKAFGVSGSGNFEGSNVLHLATDLPDLISTSGLDETQTISMLTDIRQSLLVTRNERPRPATDDKILTAWNGLLLIALAEVARAIPELGTLEMAQDLAEFALNELTVDGQLHRSWRQGAARFAAYLEDHAALGLGLIALYQVDFNTRWLQAARGHATEILDNFLAEDGKFYDTRDDHETLIIRPETTQDSPTPSGSSLAVMLLLQLAALDGDEVWTEPALEALRGMQANASRHPTVFAGWLSALDFAISPRLQLAVTGTPGVRAFNQLIEVTDRDFLPGLVRAGGHPSTEGAPALLSTRPASDETPMAYLCQDFTCQLPTNDADQLEAQIASALSQTQS